MKRKGLLLSILMLLLVVGLTGCGDKTSSGLDTDYYTEGNQNVSIYVDYKSNLFLAKDTMDIYIDNHKFYSVENGESNWNEYQLTNGTHVLKVSSDTYHYASIEFTVENTGDMFDFSIKNHTKNVDLLMTSSGNYYSALGLEVPTTVDDTDGALTEEQIKEAKSNKTIWSYCWIAVKILLKFLVITMVVFCCGMVLNALFKMFNLREMGIFIEFVAICFLSFYEKVTMESVIFPVGFLILCGFTKVRIKKIPKQYINFATVKETVDIAYSSIFGVVVAVAIVFMPEITEKLPFTVNYMERYMYAYIICAAIYIFMVLKDELNYPERVRVFVESKGVVTAKEIDDFVEQYINDDVTDNQDEEEERMLKTLADLAKAGLIDKDDNELCFRKKES